MAESAESAAELEATPNGQQPSPLPLEGGTRPAEPESARQNNIRTSKRHRAMDIRAPARLQLGGGTNTHDRAGAASNAVTSAIAPHLAAARYAIQRREIITTALAEAIDNCMRSFKSPEDTGI